MCPNAKVYVFKFSKINFYILFILICTVSLIFNITHTNGTVHRMSDDDKNQLCKKYD